MAMTKKILTLLCLLLPLAVAAQPRPQAAMPTPAAPQLGASSYILVDYNSGRVLVEHNADSTADIASMTKLMTTYVVFAEMASGNVARDLSSTRRIPPTIGAVEMIAEVDVMKRA